DSLDNIVGYRNKLDCHTGGGLLHRAFSVFLFNNQQEVLVQQRSTQKLLWPNFWSNACCSHPRRGESVEQAAYRRVPEELGCQVELHFAFKFVYRAAFEALGSEHELCSVFVGRAPSEVSFNPNEVAAAKFVPAATMDALLADKRSPYTPWMRLEWSRLRAQHWQLIAGVSG
ncbi:MAG: isopentenyl-diphosphate Delta-isomerase, partial [Deltaproteobacteria bacterium]